MATKLFIFVPAFGQIVTATTFLTTHALQQHLLTKGVQGGISTLSFPDIAELRAMAMTIWYDTMPDSSHMLFIDADMGFPPDLVTDMLLFNEPIVGTIYPQRKHPIGWAGSGTGSPHTQRRGDFMEVEGVGMGCTLIRRDVVDIMLAKMPHLVDTRLALHPAGDTIRQAGSNRIIRAWEKLDLPERGLVSEDLSFCIRWRQCGGQVWANIGKRISHVGPFDYSGRYLDTIEAMERQQEMEAAAQRAAGAQVMTPPPAVDAPPLSPAISTAQMPPMPPIADIFAAMAGNRPEPVITMKDTGAAPVPVTIIPPESVVEVRPSKPANGHADHCDEPLPTLSVEEIIALKKVAKSRGSRQNGARRSSRR